MGVLSLLGLIRRDINHDICRRPPGGFREDIRYPLEVLVVDQLIHTGRIPMSQFGEGN